MSEPPYRVHHITESRVVEIVSAALDRRDAERDATMRTLIAATVRETLTQLGVDHSDPMQMQQDFAHLRSWRKAVESVQTKSTATLLGLLIAGVVAMLVAGFKAWMGKG